MHSARTRELIVRYTEPLLRKVIKLDSHDLLAVADLGDVCLKQAHDVVPKNLADAQLPALKQAVSLCNQAKEYYSRASDDPDLKDYCASKTQYVDQFLKSLNLEISVR